MSSKPLIAAGSIILAAGSSSRLGVPKQTLKYLGNTLLQITIDSLKSATKGNIVVVLGSNYEAIKNSLKVDPRVFTVENKGWIAGLGNSIKFGIEHLRKLEDQSKSKHSTNADGFLICLCDQPLIPASHYNRLITEAHKSRKWVTSHQSDQNQYQETQPMIVATSYDDSTVGVPAFFNSQIAHRLVSLQDQCGARDIIAAEPNKILIRCDEAHYDIDTISDFEVLTTSPNAKCPLGLAQP